MKEVQCPQCKSIFEMDAAGYAEIVNQIKGEEFETELNNRIKETEKSHQIQLQLTKKDAITEKEKQISLLENQISNHEREIEFATKEAMETLQKEIFDKDKQIDRLKNEREAAKAKTDLAVLKAKADLEKDIIELNHNIKNAGTEKDLQVQSLKDSHRTEVQAKDEIIRMKDKEIERVEDMKAKMSVKEIGEKLEQWCENQFNTLRHSAFPYSHFEKDNAIVKDEDEKHGTKGDYMFRDYDSDGVEFVSIMFEMKDKMEDTKGKTNESHLSKLDIDRKKKNCEYAVLVSMLEPENEFYNSSGIVDMSHKYEKMYVVRPHYFIPILTLIRNEARKSLQIRQELEIIRLQNYDIENFENKMLDFQEGFGKNVMSARTNFETAIKDIDATIKKLEKIKSSLTTSSRQLRIANDKTQDLSIKKLTRSNPTMKAKFDELKNIDE